MTVRLVNLQVLVLSLLATLLVVTPAVASKPEEKSTEKPSTAPDVFFRTKVEPLLKARCYECHGPDSDEPEGEAGLRVDSRAALVVGGDSGPAMVPGKPAKSRLIDAINWGTHEMPPDTKIPAGEIAILTSMNLNANPRFEYFHATWDAEVIGLLAGIAQEVWDSPELADAIQMRPQQHKDKFGALGDVEQPPASPLDAVDSDLGLADYDPDLGLC